MAVEEYCPVLNCWLRAGHLTPHGLTGNPGTHLTCQCAQPRPNRLDECMNPRCRRVIVERVIARREVELIVKGIDRREQR